MNLFLKIFSVTVIIILVISSCRKNNFITDSNAKLKFSKDTVYFDTVFTGIGSAVRHLKVFNPHDLPINLSEIKIAKGIESNYRINVNGIPANELHDIEIGAKDSIYIFVDVNIDPSNDEIIEHDQIMFYTNGNIQAVDLIAYGQDIHLINDSVIDTQIWTNDKPYVVYNSMALNENESLTIEQGVHIYFHRNSRMIILGTLTVNGTYEDPVIFEGDRLNGHSSIFFENDSLDNYDDVPGQWEGIWLTKLSKDNYINFAEIKNAVTGIQVDSTQNSNPQLSIHNSKIEHHSYAGIFTQMSKMLATNCLIDDCGYYNIAFTRGGNYEFYHCTIGNYWHGARTTSALYINNYFQHPDGSLYVYDLNKAYFGNCIIWGNTDTEIDADGYTDQGIQFNYLFENSIVKIDPESNINTNDENHFLNIILNNDPIFADYYEFDFMLNEQSPAINAGNIDITNSYLELLNFDLNNISRTTDISPDIGCYEYQ